MNNMLEWLGSGLKIKRWLFLVLIGTIILSYGFSNLKLASTLSVQSILVSAILFAIGITAIVMGFLMCQKRILQAVAESNISANTRNLNLKKLLFDKKTLDKSIKVVVIGQGEGMASLLNGMKLFSNNVTAIVSTIETDAGSSKEFEISEIKRAMVALSENDERELNDFMNCKIGEDLDVGTMMLEVMTKIHDNNFSRGVCALSDVVAMSGKVLPATLDKVSISAVLSDGSRIHGKKQILSRVSENLPIEKVALVPERCTPAPNVIKSIREADAIIIGPGSLYTGILPILLIKEINDEIRKSKATKIFVSNIMTEPGQTDGYSLSDYINVLHEHAGKGIVDYCIASESDIMPECVRKYNMRGSDVIDIDRAKVKNAGVRLIVKDMTVVSEQNKIKHDSVALAKEVVDIMCQNMDLMSDKQALDYYNVKSKLKEINSKNKKKSVLLRNVKVVSKKKNKR